MSGELIHSLPTVNAVLNTLAFGWLLLGFAAIRRRRIAWHRRLMLAAVATSALFLTSYVIYHAQAGSRSFPGEGSVRAFYLAVLVTHVVLAAAIVPLVLVVLRRALRGAYAAHRRLARPTFALWAYVSVTGVIVYLMLYVWF